MSNHTMLVIGLAVIMSGFPLAFSLVRKFSGPPGKNDYGTLLRRCRRPGTRRRPALNNERPSMTAQRHSPLPTPRLPLRPLRISPTTAREKIKRTKRCGKQSKNAIVMHDQRAPPPNSRTLRRESKRVICIP